MSGGNHTAGSVEAYDKVASAARLLRQAIIDQKYADSGADQIDVREAVNDELSGTGWYITHGKKGCIK